MRCLGEPTGSANDTSSEVMASSSRRFLLFFADTVLKAVLPITATPAADGRR